MPAVETTLSVIARQDQDGSIIFDASTVPAVAESQQAFMIFYLSQADEQNGYGTVIQLDEDHGAAIYPDLNPEYTYLFYTDEQNQLQTLLWCIELATRTPDGLYIAQAKVHGRGVTKEDMERFNQIILPNAQTDAIPQHDLAEAAPIPTTSVPAAASPSPAAATQPAASIADTAAASSTPLSTPAPSEPTITAPQLSSPAVPMESAAAQPADADALAGYSLTNTTAEAQPPTPAPAAPNPTQASAPLPAAEPSQPDLLAPMPDASTPSTSNTTIDESLWPTPSANTPDVSAVETPATPTPDLSSLSLPPLPDLPSQPESTTPTTPLNNSTSAELEPAQPVTLPTLPPLPQLTSTADSPTLVPEPTAPTPQPVAPPQPAPEIPTSTPTSQNLEPKTQNPEPSKNPVGRPPKPLLTDATWTVEQPDFAWAKSISRDPIGPNKQALRQKVQQQIQRNQPDLLQNPAFQPAFDQAFEAICQTYELTPTARQDILKSLLNGRIVENLAKQLPS